MNLEEKYNNKEINEVKPKIMDKDLFQLPINKTFSNNIFDDKSDFSYFTPSKI